MLIWIRLTVLAMLAGVLTAMSGGTAQADEAIYAYTALPLTGVRDIVVDESHDRAYISGAPTDDRIVVVAGDGSILHEITGVTGATELALNGDGSRLYAAVPASDAIVEIDTASYVVTMLPTGDGTCPNEVAAMGSTVWYAEDDGCDGQFTILRILDPITGTTQVALGPYPFGYYYDPDLYRVPGSDHLLVEQRGVSGGNLDIIDTSDRSLLARQQLVNSPGDVVLSPDGAQIALGYWGLSAEFEVRSTSDLQITASPDLPAGWNPATAAGDDAHVALAADDGTIAVLDRTSLTAANKIRFGGELYPGVDKLAFLSGALFALQHRADDTVRLYRSAMPGVPAPLLTATAPNPVTVGKPATLSGTLSEGGTPLAGVELRIEDEDGAVLGRPVTDESGAWQLTHTWSVPGGVSLLVFADGDETRKTSVTPLAFVVVKNPSALALSGPTSVQPGDAILLDGTLSEDGHGVHPATVSWQANCIDPYASGPTSTVPTKADGTFTVTVSTSGTCASYDIDAWWAGDADTSAATDSQQVNVSWKRASLTLDVAGSAFLGDEVTATALLTVNDDPVGSAPVSVTITGPASYHLTATPETTSEGTVSVPFTVAANGTYTVTMTRAATADTLGASAVGAVVVTAVPSTLALAPSPGQVAVGGTVHVNGELSRADGVDGDLVVHLISSDESGARRDQFTTTGPDGTFTFTDVPQEAGTTHYTVLYAGDSPRYLSAEGGTAVTVSKASAGLVLQPDRPAYTAGQTAHLLLDTRIAGLAVTLTATEGTGSPRVVYSGVVPSAGLSVAYPMRFNTRFTLSSPTTTTMLAGQITVDRQTRLAIVTRARGGQLQGTVYVYSASADPVFVTSVRPVRSGCVRYTLQRRAATGWRTESRSRCRAITDGRVRFVLSGRQRTGVDYRIRPVFAGDARNATTYGAWLQLRFR